MNGSRLTYDLKTILLSHPREVNVEKSLAVLTSGGDSQGNHLIYFPNYFL